MTDNHIQGGLEQQEEVHHWLKVWTKEKICRQQFNVWAGVWWAEYLWVGEGVGK